MSHLFTARPFVLSATGLFAHFGSKEELQLATIEAASEIFDRAVLASASGATAAFERLRLLTGAYLDYIESDVFPGGCFFASVLFETDTRPGPVRDRLVAFLDNWLGLLDEAIKDAQAEGSIDKTEDPADLTFEIEAALILANAQFVVTHSREPIDRARRIIARRLAAASSPGFQPSQGGEQPTGTG